MKLHLLRSAVLTATTAAAIAGPLALVAPAHGATKSGGALVSARASLNGWDCDRIADEKFSCDNAAGAGFTVVQRSIASLPKWRDDAELAPEIAVVRKRYFLTVQPNAELSPAQFQAVKNRIAHRR